MNKLILTIGKTHSGKTTFAEELKDKINGVVIQTDPLAEFLKDNFPIDFCEDKEHDGSFQNQSLKMELFETILDYGPKHQKYNIILANSNLHLKLREKIIKLARQNGWLVAGVYFNYPEKVLENRIISAQKSKKVLNASADFKVLLKKQKKIISKPRSEEFDLFFEIKTDNDLEKTKRKIIQWV